jgi:hypothetical protein
MKHLQGHYPSFIGRKLPGATDLAGTYWITGDSGKADLWLAVESVIAGYFTNQTTVDRVHLGTCWAAPVGVTDDTELVELNERVSELTSELAAVNQRSCDRGGECKRLMGELATARAQAEADYVLISRLHAEIAGLRTKLSGTESLREDANSR